LPRIKMNSMPNAILRIENLSSDMTDSFGGKIKNWHRLSGAVAEDRYPGTNVPSGVLIGNLSEFGQDNEEVRGTLEQLDYPVIVRSSSLVEDAGDSRMSGLLESPVAYNPDQARDSLRRIFYAAQDVDALPVSALIQPLITCSVGLVIGVSGEDTGALLARAEFAEGRVPVDSAPAGWISWRSARRNGVLHWHVEEEDAVLVHRFDIEGMCTRLIDYIATLGWAEFQSPSWFLELEAGFDGDTLWLFQARFDLKKVVGLQVQPAGPIPFGLDRNFPAPVSRLTASILTPVLSTHFSAPIALNERARHLVCLAKRTPPPEFVADCIRATRRRGLFSFDAIADVADEFNARWRGIYLLRSELQQLPAIDAFRTARAALSEGFAWYFSNEAFRCAVGTEWLAEGCISGSLLSKISDVVLDRSRLAVEVYRAKSLSELERAGDLYTHVLLMGDDSIGTPRLLEKLVYEDTEGRAAYLVEAFLGRSEIFAAAKLGSLREIASQLELSRLQESMLASLWYQEQDNQYKDGFYFIISEVLKRLAVEIDIPLESLLEADAEELFAVARGELTSAELVLRAELRSKGDTGSLRHSVDSDSVCLDLRAMIGIRDSRILRRAEVVSVASLEKITMDGDEERKQRIYVLPSLTPLECLSAPIVGGIWLYELGELCHAAHILRSRGDISILIFGQRHDVGTALGVKYVGYRPAGISLAASETTAEGEYFDKWPIVD
jgi:hypothetical protein